MTWPSLSRRSLGGLALACATAPGARAQDGAARTLAEAANAICGRMLGGLASAASDSSFVVSPLSLADAGALLVPAAVEEAAEVLRTGFRLPSGPARMQPFNALDAALAEGASLRRATALWLRPGAAPLPAYAEAVRPLRTVSRREVDFAAPDAVPRINAWVADATGGRIRDILGGPLPPNTNAVITAALHFRANWAERFDAAATRPGPFRRAGAPPMPVPLMTKLVPGGYARDGAVHAVRLPYADAAFEFVALAPAADAPVEAVLSVVREGRAAERLGRLSFADTPVEVTLPRCQADSTTDLMVALQGTPLGPAFTSRAEYRGMQGLPTQISSAVQKAFLLLDEAGTEAAAATAIVTTTRSGAARPAHPVFRADAPFLAAVRHRASGVFVVLALIGEPRAVRA